MVDVTTKKTGAGKEGKHTQVKLGGVTLTRIKVIFESVDDVIESHKGFFRQFDLERNRESARDSRRVGLNLTGHCITQL